MAAKWEPKKELREYYRAGKRPRLIEIAEMPFIAIEGCGAPGGEGFQAAIQAMYSVGYTMKYAMKAQGRDFGIAALEAVWQVEGAQVEDPRDFDYSSVPPEQWRWKLLIAVPGFVRGADVEAAQEAALERKDLPDIRRVSLISLSGGRCVQALHVGPYATEPETIDGMLRFMEEQNVEPAGGHREIYLSDPRRAAPEKLRTILRLSVRALAE